MKYWIKNLHEYIQDRQQSYSNLYIQFCLLNEQGQRCSSCQGWCYPNMRWSTKWLWHGLYWIILANKWGEIIYLNWLTNIHRFITFVHIYMIHIHVSVSFLVSFLGGSCLSWLSWLFVSITLVIVVSVLSVLASCALATIADVKNNMNKKVYFNVGM